MEIFQNLKLKLQEKEQLKEINNMKKVKYWKVIANNLTINDVIVAIKEQRFNGVVYDRLGINHKGRLIDKYDDIEAETFKPKEIISNKWELVIPDSDEEKKLAKVRDIIKNEHFLNLTDEKIDNMDISDIWNEISNRIANSDNDIKYRIIKSIVENKLYKKS